MSKRRISTVVAVEGEKAYKAAMSNINSELKVLQSELSLSENKFKNNANSMAALTDKGNILSKQHDMQTTKIKNLRDALEGCQKAQEIYNKRIAEAKTKIEENERELEELKNTKGDTTKEQEKLTEAIEKHKKGLAEAEAGLQAAKKGENAWQVSLNKSEIELNNLNEEIAKNEKYQREAAASADENAASIDNLGKEIKETAEESKEFGNTAPAAVEQLGAALAAAGVVGGLKSIADELRACIDAAIEFEHAFTVVKKVLDGTPEQFAHISDEIKRLSTEIPLSTSEITGIAEAGARLGLAAEDILGFTETMAALGVTTTLSAEQAATQIARFANITSMSIDDADRLGSVIVALGNNFAATETEILNLSMRLAAAGDLVNISEANMLGLAATMSSLGIEAASGGTAISNLMRSLETMVVTGSDQLAEYAQVAGMTAAEFSRAWGDNAVGALSKFMQGLGDVEASGGSAIVKLEGLGVTGERMTDIVLRMAGSGDLLAQSIEMTNQAWDENSAMMTAAEKFYGTTASKQQMLENSVNNLRIAIGDQLTPALNSLTNAGTAAFSWAAGVIEEQPWLVNAITGIIAALAALAAGGSVLAVVKTTKVIPAVKAFTAALMANPVIAVASAVVGLTIALATFAATQESAASEARALNRELEETRRLYGELQDEIAENSANVQSLANAVANLVEEEEKSEAQKQALLRMVEQLNEAVPDLEMYFCALTGKISHTAEQIRDLADAESERAKMDAALERLSHLYAEQARVAGELEEAQDNLTEAQDRQAESVERTFAAHSAHGGALRALNHEVDDASRAISYHEAALSGLEEQIAELEAKTESYSETQRKNKEIAIEAEAQYKKNMQAVAGMEEHLESLIGEMHSLNIAYNETYQAAKDSLTRQMGLFEEMDGTANRSIESLIGALDSQIDFMYVYAQNIEKAMELGVDEGLVKKLSDGSEESARILAAIVEDGGENIDELNERLAKVDKGKSNFGNIVAELKTEYDASMRELVRLTEQAIKDMDNADKAYTIGSYNLSSLIRGAEGKRGALVATYESLAQSALDAWRRVMAQKSPSRRMMEAGGNDIMGVILGAKEKEAELVATYRELAAKAIVAYQRPAPSLMLEQPAAGRQEGRPQRLAGSAGSAAGPGNAPFIGSLTQIINAEETDYAGQQKKAAKELRLLARGLMQ